MGFRKPLYDVAEKGLNPTTPHKNLGSDGRLLPQEELVFEDLEAEKSVKNVENVGSR